MTIEIVILIVLILANGVFSMSEMAIVSARKVRLQQRAEDGNQGAKTALALAAQPTRFLSTVQIGITLIGIMSGAFGGATLSQKIAEFLAQYPPIAPYSDALGFGIVVAIVTYFSLVIGELVPKQLALNNAEAISIAMAPWMAFISKLTTPLVNLLSFSTDITTRLLGVKPLSDPVVTEEEIKILIEQGRQSGIFEDTEQKMVERVFRLSDRTVSSLMTHRSEMIWLDKNDPLEENLKKIIASGYSNFVVCDKSLDDVLGITRVKDLLAEYANDRPVSVATSSEQPPVVPEGMSALDVLERLREVKAPLALVVDEYGTVAGMVTLTDVLEAIVGSIPGLDITDDPSATRREDGSWLLDGMMSIHELQLLLDLDKLPDDGPNYETVGGLFIAQLGRIPIVGDKFEWEQLRFEVMDMDGHRVDKALITPIVPPALTASN